MPGPYIAIIYNALCDSAQGVAFSPAIGYIAFYDGETEKTPLISAITIQGKTLTIKTVRTTDMSVFDEITIRK